MATQANPFDQFDAPPSAPAATASSNPFDQFDAETSAPKPAADPIAQLQEMLDRGASKQHLIAKAKEFNLVMDEKLLDANLAYRARGGRAQLEPTVRPESTIEQIANAAGQYAGVATRALAPYVTAAGLGAAAGAPFAGVGAIPGAATGVLSLGLADLGTGLYDLGARALGGTPVPLPSETIQNAFGSMGVGRRPMTPTQNVFSDVLQVGTGGFGQAKSAQILEQALTSPGAKNAMRFLGENIRGQTGAAVGGAAAPSIAANYGGVTDPKALLALSLAGSLAGGKTATPSLKPISSSDIEEKASDLYRRMAAENVQVAPAAMTDLETAVRQRLAGMRHQPDIHGLVNEVLSKVSGKAGQPLSFDMLDDFRKYVRDLPYSSGGGKRGTPHERAMVKAVDDTIDRFMDNLTPAQTTAGDPRAAARLLGEARNTRALAYRTETIEGVIDAATTASKTGDNPPSFSTALRTEFGKLNKNERKMAKFDADTEAAIKEVAEGNPTRAALLKIAKLSPRGRILAAQLGFSAPGFAYAPGYTALALGIPAAVGSAAKGAANAMTKRAVTNARMTASQTPRPGGAGWNLLSPSVQQAILAQQRTDQNQNAMAGY
jgi:hypothetical protein